MQCQWWIVLFACKPHLRFSRAAGSTFKPTMPVSSLIPLVCHSKNKSGLGCLYRRDRASRWEHCFNIRALAYSYITLHTVALYAVPAFCTFTAIRGVLAQKAFLRYTGWSSVALRHRKQHDISYRVAWPARSAVLVYIHVRKALPPYAVFRYTVRLHATCVEVIGAYARRLLRCCIQS